MADLLLGTSGWGYDEWHGPFYPVLFPKQFRLRFYEQVFNTVEINTTFYHYPRFDSVLRWGKEVSPGFRFSAKIPQQITHHKRLQHVEEDLERYIRAISGLGKKIGALLIQLPPSMQCSIPRLQSFLQLLPSQYRYAVEIRHPSWIQSAEFFKLLSKFEIAYCIVDEPGLPPCTTITTDFAYLRWHGHGKEIWYDYHYSSEEIGQWHPIVEDVTDKVDTIYGYFNNHFHGYAIENCLELIRLFGQTPTDPAQIDSAEIIRPKDQESLDTYFSAK